MKHTIIFLSLMMLGNVFASRPPAIQASATGASVAAASASAATGEKSPMSKWKLMAHHEMVAGHCREQARVMTYHLINQADACEKEAETIRAELKTKFKIKPHVPNHTSEEDAKKLLKDLRVWRRVQTPNRPCIAAEVDTLSKMGSSLKDEKCECEKCYVDSVTFD